MIRKGGRCHGQLALDCLGERNQHDLFGDGRQEITNEQFQVILSAMEIFGPSKIKKLKVKLEFGNGGRTPEEFQPVFTAAQNVESLTIEYGLKNGFAAASTLSCFPDGVSFGSLKDVWVRFSPTNKNESRIVISKLIGISPNLTEISGTDEIVGIFLDEMGKPQGRLEKIVKVDTCPEDRVPQILINSEFPNLQILYLQIRSDICHKVEPILEKYKGTLVELRLSLMYGGGEELTFPNSMGKLQKINVHFMCPWIEDEYSKKYPVLKFAMHSSESDDDSNGDVEDFYPNLKEFKMDGNRQREVLRRYLGIIFPGRYRSHRSKNRNLLRNPDSWNAARFASVRNLHLSSQCEDWSDILDDDWTLRRLMYYFPNADFGSAPMIHTSSEESASCESDSIHEYFDSDDSDYFWFLYVDAFRG